MADDSLALLGLTEYEMRVYRALLGEHPATAYRLGKRSGVPLSRVYEVAARLVEKGAATVEPGEPARYAPSPPDALVAGARRRAERDLDALSAELTGLFDGVTAGGNAWLRGEAAVLAHAASMTASAQSEILVAAAAQAQPRLATILPAQDDGLHVRTLALPDSTRGGYGLVVLVDNQSALVGRLGQQADGLATSHTVLVRLCADYFRLRSVADAAQHMVAADRTSRTADPKGWIDWEEEKQRRLLQAH